MPPPDRNMCDGRGGALRRFGVEVGRAPASLGAMTDATFWAAADRHLIRYGATFSPRIIARAQGSYVYDEQGRAILDFTSGQMSAVLGHSHPDIVATVTESVRSAGPSVQRHAEPTGGRHSDGAGRHAPGDAGQGTAALHRGRVERGRPQTGQALHGELRGGVLRPLVAWHDLGCVGGHLQLRSARLRAGHPRQPEPAHAQRLPVAVSPPDGGYDWRAELDYGFAMVDAQSVGSLAACIIEPILSSGGIIDLPLGYLAALRDKCAERGMLLILDEAQTGLGRTGTMYAFERDGVTPDILTLSKTLGAGLPVAAVVTSSEIEERCHASGYPVLHHPRLRSAAGRGCRHGAAGDRAGRPGRARRTAGSSDCATGCWTCSPGSTSSVTSADAA